MATMITSKGPTALHVDLSTSVLNSGAVVRFVKEHLADRPSQDLLFKVSPETYELYRKELPPCVKVSQLEANELNAFLDRSWSIDDYVMRERSECFKCGRVLTFYDMFHSGRKRHGDGMVMQSLAGNEYILHVRKSEQAEVACTSCGTLNLVNAGYDGPEY
jgi:hypothetical protein